MPLPDWSVNPIRQIKAMVEVEVEERKRLGEWSFFDICVTLSLLLHLSEKSLIVIKALWQSAAQTLDFSGLGHVDGAEWEALSSCKLLKVKTHKSQVMWGVGGWGLLNKAAIALLFSGHGPIMWHVFHRPIICITSIKVCVRACVCVCMWALLFAQPVKCWLVRGQ